MDDALKQKIDHIAYTLSEMMKLIDAMNSMPSPLDNNIKKINNLIEEIYVKD